MGDFNLSSFLVTALGSCLPTELYSLVVTYLRPCFGLGASIYQAPIRFVEAEQKMQLSVRLGTKLFSPALGEYGLEMTNAAGRCESATRVFPIPEPALNASEQHARCTTLVANPHRSCIYYGREGHNQLDVFDSVRFSWQQPVSFAFPVEEGIATQDLLLVRVGNQIKILSLIDHADMGTLQLAWQLSDIFLLLDRLDQWTQAYVCGGGSEVFCCPLTVVGFA